MVIRSTTNSEKSSTSQNDSELTETQADILKFIRDACEANGMSPSYREIQTHFGYKAIGTVQDHVKALIKKGHLDLPSDQRRARGLVPKGLRPEAMTQIPIYGEIAAGSARDSVQLELGALTIPLSLSADPCFGLRVVGDSMQDIGILEGDVLVVQRQNRARTGDIVVALLNGETTVKRYLNKQGKLFLVPENKKMRPIEVTQGDFQIQGKVIGLQRKF